jgi:hypothetical protein
MTPNDATHDGDETATNRPEITQQYAFSVGEDGDDGSIEPADESVETSLEAFGADVDHRERDSRIAQPEASSFGIDDRKTVRRRDDGEQRALFADTEDDQRTLTGERAASQCLFANDSEPATGADTDTDAGSRTNEPAASTDTSAEGQRAIADGGRVQDSDDGRERPTRSEHADFGGGSASGMDDLGDPAETIKNDESDESAEDVEDAENDESGVQSGDGSDGEDDRDDRPDGDSGDESTDSNDGSAEGGDTFDADAETVTDDWEGVYLSDSWGHGQTNVELAQIVDVSDSGKTVLARLVAGERVDHGRTSDQLRPTAEQLGDEFRLHVREIRGEPRFKGSYPLSNDGDMDGPTRRGLFRPWSNDAGESIRQTATGYGH